MRKDKRCILESCLGSIHPASPFPSQPYKLYKNVVQSRQESGKGRDDVHRQDCGMVDPRRVLMGDSCQRQGKEE